MPTYINNKNEIYNNLPDKYINITINGDFNTTVDLLIFTVEDTIVKCDKTKLDKARQEEAKALLKKDFDYYNNFINAVYDTIYKNINTIVLNCDYDYLISNRTYKELSFFKFKSLLANSYDKENFVSFIDNVTLSYSNTIKYWDIDNDDNNTININEIFENFYKSSYLIDNKIDKIKTICKIYNNVNLNIIWFDKYFDLIYKHINNNYNITSIKFNKFINDNNIKLLDKSNIIDRGNYE